MVVRAPGAADTVLQMETVPDPAPGPGQIVVAYCGVCYHEVVERAAEAHAGLEAGSALGRITLAL